MGEHTPDVIGAKVADRLFACRKGHGGAPVSYLQLRKDDLAGIIAESIKLNDAHSRATIAALVGALEQAKSAVSAAFEQASAEYHDNWTKQDKCDALIRAWRSQANAALLLARGSKGDE